MYHDVLVDDVPDMVVVYHKLGVFPMHPRRGAPKRASVGRLLLPGEVVFPDVRLDVVGDPPVSVKLSHIPSQLLTSRVSLSWCVMSNPQVHDRTTRADPQTHNRTTRSGRRGGL